MEEVKKRMEIEKASLTYLLDEIDSVVEDLEDGTYEIVFKQPPAGQYQLTFFSHSFSFLLSFYCNTLTHKRYNVQVGLPDPSGDKVSQHVKNSPFTFTINENGEIESNVPSKYPPHLLY